MATTEQMNKPAITLWTDKVDTDLLFLLESRCIVIISQIDNEIVLELYKK
mgnify:CR=1 FL=1